MENLEYYGIRNIMSFRQENIKYFGYLCKKLPWVCKNVIGGIIQNEPTNNIDWSALHNVYYYQPGGSSTKNVMHWLQIIGADTLRQYSYGEKINLIKYNSTEAPEYNISTLQNMTIDIFITTSSGDPYCLEDDFKLMVDTFKKAKIYSKNAGNYNHLDYLWGKNAYIDIYADLLNFLNDI